MDIKIRRAKLEDAAEIANVHINSWREAYKGLLEEEYLNTHPLQFKSRLELWKKLIKKNEIVYVAESDKFGVIGFANAGAPRDTELPDHGEIYAIYLLNIAHHKGVGFKLLTSCFSDLEKLNFKKVYLWVLENNPTIKFYERSNATKLPYFKDDQIGNLKVQEHCYAWSNLNMFHDHYSNDSI